MGPGSTAHLCSCTCCWCSGCPLPLFRYLRSRTDTADRAGRRAGRPPPAGHAGRGGRAGDSHRGGVRPRHQHRRLGAAGLPVPIPVRVPDRQRRPVRIRAVPHPVAGRRRRGCSDRLAVRLQLAAGPSVVTGAEPGWSALQGLAAGPGWRPSQGSPPRSPPAARPALAPQRHGPPRHASHGGSAPPDTPTRPCSRSTCCTSPSSWRLPGLPSAGTHPSSSSIRPGGRVPHRHTCHLRARRPSLPHHPPPVRHQSARRPPWTATGTDRRDEERTRPADGSWDR